MKRIITACLLMLVLPATALASAPTPQHTKQYTRLYRQVVKHFGRRTPGRNIIKYGVASNRAATDAEVLRSIAVLQRMLAPAPQPAYAPAPVASTLAPQPAYATGAGAGGVPACASESGTNYSTGPDNTNPSSGATGRYQITPGTAAAYGCNLSTPGGQDACAAVIYAHQGASAWVGCGG